MLVQISDWVKQILLNESVLTIDKKTKFPKLQDRISAANVERSIKQMEFLQLSYLSNQREIKLSNVQLILTLLVTRIKFVFAHEDDQDSGCLWSWTKLLRHE